MKLRLPLVLAAVLMASFNSLSLANDYTWTGANSTSPTEGANWKDQSSGTVSFWVTDSKNTMILGAEGANRNIQATGDLGLGGLTINDSGYSLSMAAGSSGSLFLNAVDGAEFKMIINESFNLNAPASGGTAFDAINVNGNIAIDIAAGKQLKIAGMTGGAGKTIAVAGHKATASASSFTTDTITIGLNTNLASHWTFSGGITVDLWALDTSAASSAKLGTGTLTFDNAAILFANNSETIGNNFVINAGGMVNDNGSSPNVKTFTGSFSGTGDITRAGAATLTWIVAGNNNENYQGNWRINTSKASTLQFGNGNAFSGTDYTKIAGTGKIIGNGSATNRVDFKYSDTIEVANAIQGNLALRHIGSGTLILTNTAAGEMGNTYTGGTFVSNGGTLKVSIDDKATTLNALGTGALDIGVNSTVVIGDSTHVFGAAGAQNTTDSLTKNVTGSGTLEVYLDAVNNGTQHTINVGNDFAGKVKIKQGMLALNSGNGGSSFATNLGKGTLSMDAGTALWVRNTSNAVFANDIEIGAGDVRFRFYGDTNVTFSGAVSGVASSNIKLEDGGRLTLTGDMSQYGGIYTNTSGRTTFHTNGVVNLKTLNANSTAVYFRSGTLVLADGFTGNSLKIGTNDGPAGNSVIPASVTLSGSGATGWTSAGAVELFAESQLTIDTRKYDVASQSYTSEGQTMTLGGTITGNSTTTLVKDGAGTLVLTDNLWFFHGSLNINEGTLQMGNGGDLGAITGDIKITVGGNALLAFNRNNALTIDNNFNGAGALSFGGTADAVYTLNGALNLTGEIVLADSATVKINSTGQRNLGNTITGTGNLEVGKGTLLLSGTNDFTGNVIINTGSTLTAASVSALGNSANNVVMKNGATINFDYDGVNSHVFTIEDTGIFSVEAGKKVSLSSSLISGGVLYKSGLGELVLVSGSPSGDTLKGVTLSSGTLTLQFSQGFANNVISPTEGLVLAGGSLRLDGNNVAGATQSFTASTTAGITKIILGTDVTLDLGAVTGSGKVFFSGDSGSVIKATGSTITQDSLFLFDGTTLEVATGVGADGVLTFADGGYVELPATGAVSTNKYFLNGSGSVTDSEGAAALMIIGSTDPGNTNTLTITDGKILTVVGALTHTGGDYTITGGSLALGTLEKGGNGNLRIDSNLTTANITLSGGDLTVTQNISATGTIALGDNTRFVVDTTTSGDQTIAGILSGKGSLVKAGAGSLTLSGASTGYSGSIRVEQGQLKASIANGATSVGSLGTGSLHIEEAATVTIGSSSTVFLGTNLTKPVTGKGTLELYLTPVAEGPQTTLNLGNDFEGTVRVKAGKIALNSDNADAFSTNIGKAILALDANTALWIRNTAGGNFTNTIEIGEGEVQFRFYGNTNSTLSGKITGSASSVIKLVDGGKITLTGDMSEFGGTYNNNVGVTTFNNGSNFVYFKKLIADSVVNLESGKFVFEEAFTGGSLKVGKPDGTATTGTVVLSSTHDLDLNGNIEIKGASTLTVDTRKFDTSTRDYVDQGLTLTLSGILSGTEGKLTKAGVGTLILTGAHTYGGLTTVSGGTLQVGNGGTVGSLGAGAASVSADAFLTYNRSDAVTVATQLGGAGTVKFLTGTYSLTNTGNNVSKMLLESGTLKINAVGAGGSANTTVTLKGGTYEYGITGIHANNIALDVATGDATVKSDIDGVVLGGTVTGTGNFLKTGTGTLIFEDVGATANGQNFTGQLKVSAGMLQLGQAPGGDRTGDRTLTYGTGDISVSSGATLGIAFAENQTINTLSNKVVLENGGTLYNINGNTVLQNGIKAGTVASDSVTLSFKYDHYIKLGAALEGKGTLNIGETGESVDYSRGGSGLILTQDSTGFEGTIVVGKSLGDSITRYGQYLQLDSVNAASNAVIDLKTRTAGATGGSLTNTQLRINVDNAVIGGLNGDVGTLVLSGATANTGDSVDRTLIINGNGIFHGTLGSHLSLEKNGVNTTQVLGNDVLGNGAGTQMTVNQGILALGNSGGALGTGLLASSYTINDGGTLRIDNKTGNQNASVVTGTVGIHGGTLLFADGLDENAFAQKVIFTADNGQISGGSGQNDHRGWVLSHGATTADQAANIEVSAGIAGSAINANKVFFQNATEEGAAVFTMAVDTDLILNSAISAGTDANGGSLKIQGGGTLVFTGNSNGANGVAGQKAVKAIIENGILQIGNGGTTGSWQTGNIQLGATGDTTGATAQLNFDRSDDAMSYNGILSGYGTVNFNGTNSSVYTLGGQNTFTGAVNINAGRVAANSDHAFGTGNTITLKSGATVDYLVSQSDTTSVINAQAGSAIAHGSNFNGILNILANTEATAVTVSGGLSVGSLSFANNSYLTVSGALSSASGTLSVSEGAHLTAGSLNLGNQGILNIGKNAVAILTDGIGSSVISNINLQDHSRLEVAGNVSGGHLTLDKQSTVVATNGDWSLRTLTIKDTASSMSVGGDFAVTNGGYLYLDTGRADTAFVTATGNLDLKGTFLLGFDVNQVTDVGEFTFKLFTGASYGDIQAELDFQDPLYRSFYYLDASSFYDNGTVTLVHTDWGYKLVDEADITGMGGSYTPQNGKELLGSKSLADGGGSRQNPLEFSSNYTPVANDSGEIDYRLTDGEGWLNFQSKMTGSGVGLLIQSYLAYTGAPANHGIIISNNSNDYTGDTRVLNARVVLDSSLAANESDKLTNGHINMLGTGNVTFMGNTAVLELRPNGDAGGDFVFSNNLSLRDGATLKQTGGSTTLTGKLNLQGGLGGILENATSSALKITGGIQGSVLTLKGKSNAVAGSESVVELSGMKADIAQRAVDRLVLTDKIHLKMDAANLEAKTLTMTSGILSVMNGSELRVGAVSGSAGSTLILNGSRLTTAGTGALITLGGSGAPNFSLEGTGNIITVGNTGGLEIKDLIGSADFTTTGGKLLMSGGTQDSHFTGNATVDAGLLVIASDAWFGGNITVNNTGATRGGLAVGLQITGGSSLASRTVADGSITLADGMAATVGNHVTLGDVTLLGVNRIGGEGDLRPDDVKMKSLTMAGEGSAVFGKDLQIAHNAHIGEGVLVTGGNALVEGNLAVAGGSISSGTNLMVRGNTLIGDGIVSVDSAVLNTLQISGTGGLITKGTSGVAHTLTISGDANVGNGTVSADSLVISNGSSDEVDVWLQDGKIVAEKTMTLGNLTITGTGAVGTVGTSSINTLTLRGDASIGNGTLQAGTLVVAGVASLHNGSLIAGADNSTLGGLIMNGENGKAEFKNSLTITGETKVEKGVLTAGNNARLGTLTTRETASVQLGDSAQIGSLDIGSGSTLNVGKDGSFATGSGQNIEIGSNASVHFGDNSSLGATGGHIQMGTGAHVSFGANSHINGNLSGAGLVFVSDSTYSGFLNAGSNNVSFEKDSLYLLDGPVLQQYSPETVGLSSSGVISIDNDARFVLGENLGKYSILEAPETMTVVSVSGNGKLLVEGEAVGENVNYTYLLENADKYFEWVTFSLFGGKNSLELEMLQFTRFETVAETGNEFAMARVANDLATGARFYTGELKELSTALALTAKGQGHENLSQLAMSNSSLLSGYLAQTENLRRHAFDTLNRVVQEKPSAERLSYEQYNNSIWANGIGSTYSLKGDSNSPGSRTDIWGGTLGTSTGYSEYFVAGAAFSYAHSKTTVNAGFGDAKGDSYDIDLFGKYSRDNWNFIGIITGGMTSLDTTRQMNIADYSSRTTASANGSHLLATIQVGRQFVVSDDQNSILEPFALITGGYSSIDGFSEKGAGNAGLTVDSKTQSLCTAGVGVRFSREYFALDESAARGRFEVRAMVLQDLAEMDADLTARYQGMTSRDSFSLSGTAPGSFGFLVGAGIVHPLGDQTSVFADVDGEFRSGENGVRANIGLKYQF